ncbi:retinoblastoma-like protein 2 [Cimex lectularius]|uniref:Retinoblastoma-like protein 1 n=1 Tax=Cimex lectularius TaxID=79782 RepID=A0A8I6THM8_CIMLE|nr:retinoblastoma-like protein 2 [Cimex lectularius]
MGLSEETERKLQKNHQDLCKSLNLDKGTSNETWKTFKKVYDTIVLDGNPLHWLGCALYISCKTSTTPSVSKSHVVIQGNQVSLDRLVRAIDLNLQEFFIKIRKWVSVQDLQPELRENIIKLEQVFNVSVILFKKFQPIFYDMFQTVSSEQSKNHKSKKLRQPLPSINRVFEFTWGLFLSVKANFPNIVNDLVNLYPLLLCCCDFIYANAVLSGRKDIIKEGFQIQYKSKYNDISEVPCIIDRLCELHDGIPIDVKSVKEYCWRKQVKAFFDKSILKGNADLLSGVLDINNFDQNFKSINKNYEEFVLSSSSFDERVFTGYQTNGKLVTDSVLNSNEKDPKRKSSDKSNNVIMPFKKNFTFDGEVPSVISVKPGPTLKNILSCRPLGPGEYLKQLKCTTKMEEVVVSLSLKLVKSLTRLNSDEELKSNIKENEYIVSLVNKMFYKLLDSILAEEIKKPDYDAERLLNQEIVINTLFACAFEIISYTMELKKNFPWILEVLNVNAFHFYRIIEVVVRNEDSLKRDVIRHLKVIEETILESMAWKKDSPLWTALIESTQPIPTSEDVIVSSANEEGRENDDNLELKIDVLAGKSINLVHSPGAPLADKFLSPNRNKRQIGETVHEWEPANKVLKMANEQNVHNVEKRGVKPKRTGSIALFFRKFYYLASVRLKDMCNQLRLVDSDLRMKIWTCFEKTIVQNVSLMLDRHLDQMLMCSIYVICKIVSREISFMDMMKCYRNQPQAKSHVYRNVLIRPNKTLEELKTNNNADEQEEKGDIIKFYNEIYIQKVKELTKKFRNQGENDRLVLSPIPTRKCTPVNCPKRVSESLPIYLSGHKRYLSPNSNPLNYYFAKSPAKDLKAINMMVSHEMIPKLGRQLLNDNAPNVPAGSLATRRVRDVFAERMNIIN